MKKDIAERQNQNQHGTTLYILTQNTLISFFMFLARQYVPLSFGCLWSNDSIFPTPSPSLSCSLSDCIYLPFPKITSISLPGPAWKTLFAGHWLIYWRCVGEHHHSSTESVTLLGSVEDGCKSIVTIKWWWLIESLCHEWMWQCWVQSVWFLNE